MRSDALNVPLQKAKMLKTKFSLLAPKVGQFVDGVISTGRGRGYVVITGWVEDCLQIESFAMHCP